MKGEEASAIELWRGSIQPYLQENISPGEEPAPPSCRSQKAKRGQRGVGSTTLPPLPSPLNREIRVRAHEKGGKKSLFLSNNKEFL